MIKSERYLLTATTGERTRKMVWDASRPMGIGFPFRWIIERTPDGARIRYLGGQPGAASGQVVENVQLNLDQEQLLKGENVEFPDVDPVMGGTRMRIQPIGKIRPPYMVRTNQKLEASSMPFQLFAYAGIQRSMVKCEPVEGAYAAYFRGKPVFTAYKNGDGLQIKPLISGIFIKVKGGPAIPAYPNETLQLASHKVPLATIVRGHYWWKFNFVQLPEPPIPGEEPDKDPHGTWFIGAFVVLGALFLALLGGVVALMPAQVTELKPEDKKPQIVTFHATHKLHRKTLAATKSGHRSEAGSAGSPAQAAKTQPQKRSAEPAPIKTAQKADAKKNAAAPRAASTTLDNHRHAPKLVQKQADFRAMFGKLARPKSSTLDQVRAAPHVKAPTAPPQPSAAEIAAKRSAMAMARQAAFLKDAVQGAQTLADRNDIMNAASQSDNANGTALMGRSMVGQMSPTEIHANYSGSGKAVAGFGGGATSPDGTGAGGTGHAAGLGYGRGARAGLAGQGNSLVNVDSGGAAVAEGLTKEEVGAVIHSHMTEIRYCHEQSLLSNPSTQGKLVLEFTINANGRISAVSELSSSLTEATLGPCIVRRLRMWKFPDPKGGVNVTVSYPFLFRTLGRE